MLADSVEHVGEMGKKESSRRLAPARRKDYLIDQAQACSLANKWLLLLSLKEKPPIQEFTQS
jgi:hypothetical protein